MARYIFLIITFITLLNPSKLTAEDKIPGNIIIEAVENILALNNVNATPVINEKKLFPKCAHGLNVSPMHQNWKTVSVECDGILPWKIIIRNKFSSTQNVSSFDLNKKSQANVLEKRTIKKVKVGAIKRSIRRGDVITPTDVIEISISENKATDIFPNFKDLIGRRAKTTIKALTPVFSRQLETNFMIEEDMQVEIIHHSTHISVQMEGIALENGQFGDWIKVKNIKSGRIILAKVVAEKKVNV